MWRKGEPLEYRFKLDEWRNGFFIEFDEYGTAIIQQEHGGMIRRKDIRRKHTPDVVDSGISNDIFPASEVSASEAESMPATTRVM